MREIRTFAAIRPDISELTPEERDAVWARVVGDWNAVEPSQRRQVGAGPPASTPNRRRIVVVAAVIVALAGIAGTLLAIGRDESPRGADTSLPTTVAPRAGDAPVVAYVPSEMPFGLGLEFPGSVSVRDEPSIFQRRVYGATADPGNPTRMINLEYAALQYMAVPCMRMPDLDPSGTVDGEEWLAGAVPMEGSSPFPVGTATGYTCSVYGPLTAGWGIDGVGVQLSAGSAVTVDELVAFAQALRTVPPAVVGDDLAPVDLVADPLPAGWTVLVGEDVPYAQRVTESAWGATFRSDGSGSVPDGQDQSQVGVHTWTGADEQGIFAKMPPIQAERITVRGHQGYQFESEQMGEIGPLNVEVWWTEAPGVVVYVSASNYDLEAVDDLINALVPVDAEGFDDFNLDQDNY